MSALGAALLGGLIAALGCLVLIFDQRNDVKKLRGMSDAGLIANGRWDECDNEPLNIYAEEYERRHGINSKEKA